MPRTFSLSIRWTASASSLFLFLMFVGVVAGSRLASAQTNPPSWDAYEPSLLDVKFAEGTKIRVRAERPHSATGNRAHTAALDGIVRSIPGGKWRRGHSVSPEELERLRTEGIARSGRPLPDLELYQRLELPPGLDAWRAKQILMRSPVVEGAYLVARPAPPPAAPDYSLISSSPRQGYLDAAPAGIDARYAWSLGWAGQGISICDVEFDFNDAHVDLPFIRRVGGMIHPNLPDPVGGRNHGTAVFGVMVGRDDATGVRGIAHAAGPLYFSPVVTATGGTNIASAITQCASALEPGGVLLLELQIVGPNPDRYVPVEWNKPTYDAIRTAVANGIVVIEPAGNFAENLDAPIFSTGNDGHWPFLLENDSGAIMVTAGSAATPHSQLFFSNYGATVDLQAWGESVVTTGYGDLFSQDGPNALYTSVFQGSSSASPIVVGAIANLQSAYKALTGTVLPAAQVRSLLRSTGTPGSGVLANVPLPNLHAALDSLIDVLYVDDDVVGGSHDGSSWANAYDSLSVALAAARPGTIVMVAEGIYRPAPPGGPRSSTFALANGVALLGGFPNGGGERNPDAHPTILSGDISLGPADSYHVVTGSFTDPTAILDGFTIKRGRADGASPDQLGAGLYAQDGSPTIRNTRFEFNFALVGGGGAFVFRGNPTFLDVVFENNVAGSFGGGMYGAASNFLLNDVRFISNQVTSALAEGGGLFTTGNGVSGTTPLAQDVRFHGNFAFRGGALSNWPGSNLRIDNAVFSGNQSTDLAGAILNFDQGLGGLLLDNATFAGNQAPLAGAIYAFSPMTIKNSILWNNGPGPVGGAGVTVSTSIVEGGFAGTGVTSVDPLFRDADGLDDIMGTLDDDFRLAGASPAIDAGGTDCTGADILGHDRIGACDQGAHEYMGDPGTFWSNGEVDSLALGESFDQTPIGGPIRQSADDFTILDGQVCGLTGIRGVLFDPSAALDATVEIYGDAGGIPGSLIVKGSVGPLSGSPLGSLFGARLWQYRFDFVQPLQLNAGRYWISIYGKQEAGSVGSPPAAVTAGEGRVRGRPYQFREVGFDWVDGSLFFGGTASRDLALDIDATCVPEPALGLQLLAGSLALAGLGRKKARA